VHQRGGERPAYALLVGGVRHRPALAREEAEQAVGPALQDALLDEAAGESLRQSLAEPAHEVLGRALLRRDGRERLGEHRVLRRRGVRDHHVLGGAPESPLLPHLDEPLEGELDQRGPAECGRQIAGLRCAGLVVEQEQQQILRDQHTVTLLAVGATTPPAAARGQYQPEDSEWLQAPQGEP
jgi:hypothetical protein